MGVSELLIGILFIGMPLGVVLERFVLRPLRDDLFRHGWR